MFFLGSGSGDDARVAPHTRRRVDNASSAKTILKASHGSFRAKMSPAPPPWFYSVDEFLELNPDLRGHDTTNPEEVERRTWKEGRLCSRKQLEVRGEFGLEAVIWIPYFYWLFRKGYLFDHGITTYHGMEPFYFFLPEGRLRFYEDSARRFYEPYSQRSLYQHTEFARTLEGSHWLPPPLRSFYARRPLPMVSTYAATPTAKPLLLLQNKFCDEWNAGRSITFRSKACAVCACYWSRRTRSST